MRQIPDRSASRRRRAGVVLAAIAAIAAGGYWVTTTAPRDAARRDANAAPSTPATGSAQPPPAASVPAPARRPPRTAAASAPQPLPPRDTPLVAEFDELKARADAGDAAAASRLFRDVQRCVAARRAQHSATELAPQVLDARVEKMDADDIATDDSALRMIEGDLAYARSSAARCAGMTRDQLDALTPATLRAAQLGDPEAADCYTGSMYQAMRGLLDHPEWLAEYKRNAPQLLERGVRAGDWFAVAQLQNAYSGDLMEMPLAQTIVADAALQYRYLALERLGAHDDVAQMLDENLANVGRELSAAQTASADAWARDAYARYFHGSASDEATATGGIDCLRRND